MSSIAACIYVDRYREVGYPVPFITESLDEFDAVFWIGSDEENVKALTADAAAHRLAGRIRVLNLEFTVEQPSHIQAAQTKSVALVREHGPDFVVIQQADIMLTEFGIEYIKAFIRKGNGPKVGLPFGVPCMVSKLYHELYAHVAGVSVVPPGAPYHATSGRAFAHGYRQDPAFSHIVRHDFPHVPRPGIDISYFDTGMYYRKMLNHQRLWPDARKPELAKLYEIDRRAFVVEAMKDVRAEAHFTPPIIPNDYEYRRIIGELGLHDDFMFVREALGDA